MSKLPQSYTYATSIEGLEDLYKVQPENAHNVLRSNTVQELITRDITLLQACQSGYFPHTLPTEIRKPKRLIAHRRYMKKMLNLFPERQFVRNISEQALWYLKLHVSFDFAEMNLREGTIHKPEMAENKRIRRYLTSPTLTALRTMVHNIQSQIPDQESVVLPTFNKLWRRHPSFDESDWDNPDHPLNDFLIHHQEQPVFGDFDIGLFDGQLASREEPWRRRLQAEYKRSERAKKNKAHRSKSTMTLNPYDLRPCNPPKNRPKFR